ncbi:MAG: DUF938 domain-containing protein [Polyangiaceae bacterium]|nr:DUF938 domain-containing protein [Polyangiaceae bacterium]
MKLSWTAPERNKRPILEVLQRVLPPSGRVLEISSGTGQHASHFAHALPSHRLLPSDVLDENLESIRAYVADAGLPNLEPPLRIDVLDRDYQVGTVDAVFNANMIHIAPWECAVALFEGAARHLRSQGILVLYGPFRVGGTHTAESNAAFDASLRERDSRWGVRDIEAVEREASRVGLTLEETVPMPANNLCLVFRRA